jgi:hypothetical protein
MATDESAATSCPYCGRANVERLPACAGCSTILVSEPPQTDEKPKGKSKLLAVSLAVLLGPVGLCYVSVSGGVGMIVTFLLLRFLLHGGLWVAITGRIICAAWALVALSEREKAENPAGDPKRLLDQAALLESVDRSKAIAGYQEIVNLFPNTAASREAARNIQTLTKHTQRSD